MKIKAFHPQLTDTKTYLTAKAESGQKNLVCLNAENFSADDFVVIGGSGEENSEIGKIASISGNTITLAVNLGLAHPENTAITIIEYDKVQLYKATSSGGEYLAQGSAQDIAIDDEYTLLEDSTGVSTDYFKIKYYNSETETYSDYSDAITTAGFPRYALASIQDHALDLAEDQDEKKIKRDMVTEWVNEWKDIVCSKIIEINEKYFLSYTTQTLTSGTAEYDLPSRCRKIQKIEVNLSGEDYYRARWEDIEDDNPDYVYSADDPRYYINNEELGFRPTPTAAGTAKIWYEAQPADLEDDADELDDPLKYYLHNLFDFLEFKINKQLRKSNEADSAWAKFNNGIDDIIEEANNRVFDNRQVKESDDEFILI